MTRLRYTWPAFLVSAAILLAGLGRVTWTAVRLDRADRESQRHAALEEAVRLALWRIDSALMTLHTQESARPPYEYQAFYPAQQAYNRLFAQLEKGEILVPSPLLGVKPPFVKIHFQYGPDGALTSPQAPTGNMRDNAEIHISGPVVLNRNDTLLARLNKLIGRDDLESALAARPSMPPPSPLPDPVDTPGKGKFFKAPKAQSRQEYTARAQQMTINSSNAIIPQGGWPHQAQSDALMRSIWLDGELFLARTVVVDNGACLQGCWLDWDAIRKAMRDTVTDLLPNADLVPAPRQPEPDGTAHMLASFPVRLVPGELPEVDIPTVSTTTLALLVAWGGILVALGAIAILLYGALTLSERRAAFVSAVTHELRTPLTTFRMYTEMLADGMIADEAKRAQYLKTLHNESNRLGHLVENVLTYARIERGSNGLQRRVTSVSAIVDAAIPRLRQRADQAGIEFTDDVEESARCAKVRTNAGAVEQILTNLVDNACKYGRNGDQDRIGFRVAVRNGSVVFAVRDRGHGLSEASAKTLFHPFAKSAQQAAQTAPGIGLGLALSDRLARSLGGDLVLAESSRQGACFELHLPVELPGHNT